MKKNFVIKILMITCLILLLISVFYTNSFAIDTSRYNNIYTGDVPQKLIDVGNPLVGIVQQVGSGIALIMLIVIGVRYVTASVEQKAQIKGQLIVFVIGAILLFGGVNLFAMIANATKGI